jgi:hypothetical protein
MSLNWVAEKAVAEKAEKAVAEKAEKAVADFGLISD